jgi:chromosome segregation ATPase
MKTVLSSSLLILLFFVSCGKKSSEYERLQATNDSLLQAKMVLQHEVDAYFSDMNQIQENLEKIKSTQNSIQIQPLGQELEPDIRSKINEDLSYLNDMLQANKEEIAKLKTRLKNSSFKSAELERTIVRLTQSLEEETLKVALLEARLAEKDSLIAELGMQVDELGKNMKNLTADIESKESKIAEQEESLHTAYYVFGTNKELKEQKIVSKEGLFSPQRILQKDFNRNYFVKIDYRKTKTIPLYSQRAKILSSHPKSSYALEKEKGNFILLIINPSEFWSISKYLVIEVD